MSNRVARAADLGLSLEEILQRVALEAGAENDAQTAHALGVGRSTVIGWKKADSVPFEPLFAFAKKRNLSMDWLLGEIGEKHISPKGLAAQEQRIKADVFGVSEPAVKPATSEVELERMQDCIQVLTELAVKRGRMPKPDKFARACVLLYELSKQAGAMPATNSVNRLLETID